MMNQAIIKVATIKSSFSLSLKDRSPHLLSPSTRLTSPKAQWFGKSSILADKTTKMAYPLKSHQVVSLNLSSVGKTVLSVWALVFHLKDSQPNLSFPNRLRMIKIIIKNLQTLTSTWVTNSEHDFLKTSIDFSKGSSMSILDKSYKNSKFVSKIPVRHRTSKPTSWKWHHSETLTTDWCRRIWSLNSFPNGLTWPKTHKNTLP